MKKAIILVTMLVSFTAIAQQGINYKAVIKDDLGNVVANQTISIEFAIQKGMPFTNVYTETHAPTTDTNGIIIVNIGEGTVVNGVFNNIDWNSDDHYLNVQIDIGDGNLTDLGTTQFMAVPYALNVTGLEALDESNGSGWRLKGQNPNAYGNIGNGAVDLSYNASGSTLHGATGDYAFATGSNNIATGDYSTVIGLGCEAFGNRSRIIGDYAKALGYSSSAFGERVEALGDRSTAMGTYSIAEGDNSVTIGNQSVASRDFTIAIGNVAKSLGTSSITLGNFITAHSRNEIVVGSWNTDYTPNSVTSWHPLDRLFVVGNGPGSKSNALTILKNGNVALGNINPEYILDIDGRARVRAEGAELSQTAGIWYSDLNGGNSMFAGAKTHSTAGNSREWGLYINGAYRFWVNGAGNVYANGSLVHSSDRRLKKDIKELSYGLKEVLQLAPKEYFWKDKTQEHASLGLIAQEVEEVIANVVHTGTDDKKTLSLSYIELIPVLINAIKEQDQKISDLEAQLLKVEHLEARLNALENRDSKDNKDSKK